MSSPPERFVSGCRITNVRIKRHVRIHFRPDAHSSGFGCVDAFGTRRKRLVLQLDELSGLSRSRQGFCNDERDALTDEPHPVEGKRVVRSDEHRLAVAIA